MVHEVENFYGVYLLYNVNPKFKGRTYIGFTVDPNRRVKQHNTGKHAGGAWRTSGKGPWEMVIITHGFPNEISALRFEWAWQNPGKSRRLSHLPGKTRKETAYQYRFRIFSEMLRTGPWNRLALTVRWLKQEYQLDFSPECPPPLHMAIAYGPVKAVRLKDAPSKRKKKQPDSEESNTEMSAGEDVTSVSGEMCCICQGGFMCKAEIMRCYRPECHMTAHMVCLSRLFLTGAGAATEDGCCPLQVIPVGGMCPSCAQELLWGDLIRYKQGCFQAIQEETSSDGHWTNDLQASQDNI
ncbi:structure-specific endonuclease subunit slx1-like [Liolophura sinensis]|uniref:structure-specific endonuclease subunit slx1-like n=1 Tax=Liolophura sinensis TaxID=3198878 RepID=UPI003158C6B9